MSRRIKTNWNNSEFPKLREHNNSPSLTVPDQSMTITEIMRRYASGLPLTGARVPTYDEEDERPDPATLDLSQLKDEIDEIDNSIKQRKQEKDKKDADEKAALQAKADAIAAAKEKEERQEALLTRAFKKARKSSTDE